MLDVNVEPALQEPEATTPERRDSVAVLTTAELAECTCPDFCERDHDLD